MPIPVHSERSKNCSPKGAAVSLPVLPGKPAVRPSKMGPRRAAVLIGVHVLMITHVLIWYFGGKGPTISPVEPSESMYTLEQGQLNAGFVFFALALLATALLGRFVCGWACHLVALQDLCGWFMKKCGVHPKPFRSRLLLWAPLILAFYMFIKPTLVREVIRPLAGANWAQLAPYVGQVAPRPQLRAAFVKTEFWETFATWSAAIPFLAVCGFGVVYFLGAKGFCTYGCPYGGFFAPLDTLALGRIRVTDACEHCGHCTSVCTSNVRVHEEVRDYGMVTDPGCMKCMDCVSVCPNDALYFGLGMPALLAGARTEKPSKPKFRQRTHDLSWPQEIAAALLFLGLFWSFRGMLDRVPLLMAMGMAGIGTYLTWKLYAMFGTASVRIQSLQLKLKGRLRPAGALFALLAMVLLATAAWSGVVRFSLWRAGLLFDRLTAPADAVFSLNYTPPDPDRPIIKAALRNFRRADSRANGGIGWRQSVQQYADMAYLSASLGDYPDAELNLRRAIDRAGPRGPGFAITSALGKAIALEQRPIDDAIAAYQQILDRNPQHTDARLMLGSLEGFRGRADAAADHAARAVADRPGDPGTLSNAAQIMMNISRLDQAEVYLRRYLEIDPTNRQNRLALASVLVNMNQLEAALAQYQILLQGGPPDPNLYRAMAALLNDLSRTQEAAEMERRAAELDKPH